MKSLLRNYSVFSKDIFSCYHLDHYTFGPGLEKDKNPIK